MKNNFRTWFGGAITGLAFIFTIFVATGTTAVKPEWSIRTYPVRVVGNDVPGPAI